MPPEAPAPVATPTPIPPAGKKVGDTIIKCGKGAPDACEGIGLRSPMGARKLAENLKPVRDKWDATPAGERGEALRKAINASLGPGTEPIEKIGEIQPALGGGTEPVKPQGESDPKNWGTGVYNAGRNDIQFPQGTLKNLPQSKFGEFAQLVTHEARHAEQANLIARAEAGKILAPGQEPTAADVAAVKKAAGVNDAIAERAVKDPLEPGSPAAACAEQLKGDAAAQECHDRIYGQQPALKTEIDAANKSVEESKKAAKDAHDRAMDLYKQGLRMKDPQFSGSLAEANRLDAEATRMEAEVRTTERLRREAYDSLPEEGDAELAGKKVREALQGE